MTLPTKADVLQTHQDNHLLNLSAPMLMGNSSWDLSVDEFAAPLDEHIIEKVMEALDAGQTHYVDVPGIAPLRESVATFLNETTGTMHQKTNVIVTAGMQESRFLTIQMIGAGLGQIAIPSIIHPGVLRALGVRPFQVDRLPVSLEKGVLPKVDNIQSTVDNGTRLLYLESPSRLTGEVYNAEEVAQIAKIVAENDVTVIWDQGLSVWVEDYVSLASQPDMATHVVTIGEAFPGVGLSSWFIGYIAAPEASVPAMQSQKQIMAICTSTPSQYAALEASKSYAHTQTSLLSQMKSTRQQWINALQHTATILNGQAQNILAVRVEGEHGQRLKQALSSVGASVSDGSNFGAPDVVRINMTQPTVANAILEHLQ